jgi:hypothetical protein
MTKELYEVCWNEFSFSEELNESTGTKQFYITGQLQEADLINENGRVYPYAILAREVQEMKGRLQKRNTLMAGNHPVNERDPNTPPHIRIEDQAARLVDIWMEGKKVMGKAIVADTDAGRNVKALVRIGTALGISSRGKGDVKEDKWEGLQASIVQDNYKLKTCDFVIDQSVPDAEVKNFVEEQKMEALKMEKMTKDELKKQNPEVYEDIRKEVAAELNDQFNTKMRDEVKNQISVIEAKLKTKYGLDESGDETPGTGTLYFGVVKQFLAVLKAAGILGPNVSDLSSEGNGDSTSKRTTSGRSGGLPPYPGADASGDSADIFGKESKNHDVTDKLIEKIEKLEGDLEKMSGALTAEKLSKYVLEKTSTHKYADVVRDRVGSPTTIEEADKAIAAAIASVDALTERVKNDSKTPVPLGKGFTFTEAANKPAVNTNPTNMLMNLIGRQAKKA